MGETHRHPGSSCVLFYLGRGSIEMVIFDLNPGLTFWCIWKCRQEATSSRDTKMNKGKEARNLRYVNDFLLSFVSGRRRRQRKWQHAKQRGCGCWRGHDKRAGSMESKLCLLSQFAKGQLCLGIWRENWDYLCSTKSNTSEATRSWELLS